MEPTAAAGGIDHKQEIIMQLRARASDWHPGNPKVKPGLWLGAFLGAVILYIVVAGLIGAYVNGDGSPYLSSI